MKVTIELTTEEEIKTFYGRMIAPDKPNITMFAAPSTPDPRPAQELPDGFQPAPESVPFQESAPQPEPLPIPAPQPAQEPANVSFDDVTKAAIKKMDAGKQTELRALLQKHGVQSLPELKNDQVRLTQFYQDLEVL